MRYQTSLALGVATMVLGLGLAAPAFAQGERAPFTGPHVEALLGYDHLSGGDDGTEDGVDGLQYGGAAGYDVQFGPAIVGIEGEVSGSSAKIRARDIDVVGDSLRLKAGRDLYVGARVGYAIAPTTLLYLKGGYTNQRINLNYNDGAGGLVDDHVTLDGWRIGAGVEQKFNMFGPGGFVKVEYRYSNYSNVNYGDLDVDTNVDRHQVVAGIGVRF